MAHRRAPHLCRRRHLFGIRQSLDADDADLPVSDFRSRADQPQHAHAGHALPGRARVHRRPVAVGYVAPSGAGPAGDPHGDHAWRSHRRQHHHHRAGKRWRQRAAAQEPAAGTQLHVGRDHSCPVRRPLGAALLRRCVPNPSEPRRDHAGRRRSAFRHRHRKPARHGEPARAGERARIESRRASGGACAQFPGCQRHGNAERKHSAVG